ncbi:MAG TPA: 50S ribosomal protein L25 [Candidatus Azoamicus sp. OHIO1]
MISTSLTINAEMRGYVGKSSSRRLRHNNKIPAVIYSKNESICVALDLKYGSSIFNLLSSGGNLMSLQVNGTIFNVIVKHIHKHPYKSEILHFDFQKVEMSDYVKVNVSFRFLNEVNSIGMKNGGVLIKQILSAHVICKVSKIPVFLDVDILNLNLNQSIYLSDILLPEDVKLALLQSRNKLKYLIASVGASKVSHSRDDSSSIKK